MSRICLWGPGEFRTQSGFTAQEQRPLPEAELPFTPVFIPLSPCWVTGLSVTLSGADRTPAAGTEAPPLAPVPGTICVGEGNGLDAARRFIAAGAYVAPPELPPDSPQSRHGWLSEEAWRPSAAWRCWEGPRRRGSQDVPRWREGAGSPSWPEGTTHALMAENSRSPTGGCSQRG